MQTKDYVYKHNENKNKIKHNKHQVVTSIPEKRKRTTSDIGFTIYANYYNNIAM